MYMYVCRQCTCISTNVKNRCLTDVRIVFHFRSTFWQTQNRQSSIQKSPRRLAKRGSECMHVNVKRILLFFCIAMQYLHDKRTVKTRLIHMHTHTKYSISEFVTFPVTFSFWHSTFLKNFSMLFSFRTFLFVFIQFDSKIYVTLKSLSLLCESQSVSV